MDSRFNTSQVYATVIQDSVSPEGVRITTWEVNVPKFLLAEINTHRVVSRNYQSSRAVPTSRVMEMVLNEPMLPVFYGKNQAGMSAREESNNFIEYKGTNYSRERFWGNVVPRTLVELARALDDAGYHKQDVSRILECVMPTRGVITMVDTENFYNLRMDDAAQPAFQVLANSMKEESEKSETVHLESGEWHVPYVNRNFDDNGNIVYSVDGKILSLEEAKMISASCCAQVSYRRLDRSLEKAKTVFERLELTPGNPLAHYSPVEHQARPLNLPKSKVFGNDELVTHITRDGWCYSGNFRGWGQYRKEIEGGFYN